MARLALLTCPLLLLIASCTSTAGGTVPVADPGQVTVNQNTATEAIALLNHYRAIGSLPPVKMDQALSTGCQLHANYLVTNKVSLSVVGPQAHTESAFMPGYTTQGARAAQNSVIYEGVTAPTAVRNWMQTLYHRLGMMDPNLTRVGFGSAGAYQVMDIGQGRSRGWLAHDSISLFPWPGMTDVPSAYIREIPHPIAGDYDIGIPITIEFFGMQGSAIGLPEVHVRDVTDNNRELGVYLEYPGHAFLPDWDLPQLIAIIPRSPLPAHSVIEVEVSGIVDGGTFNPKWRFTTR